MEEAELDLKQSGSVSNFGLTLLASLGTTSRKSVSEIRTQGTGHLSLSHVAESPKKPVLHFIPKLEPAVWLGFIVL